MFDILNKGKDTMILRPEEIIGIIDLRSLRYYKIKQEILQQNLSRYYRFEKAEKLCKYFNKFVTHIEKGKRTKITDRQIPMVRPK